MYLFQARYGQYQRACLIHSAIHPHFRSASASFVRAAHDRGLAVNVWTVDEPGDIELMARRRVNAIITNVPDLARTVLESIREPGAPG